MKFFAGFDSLLANSGIYSFLTDGVFTERFYETSAFYGFLKKLRIKLFAFIEKTVLSVRERSGSLTVALLEFLASKNLLAPDVFLALFIGFMIIMPNAIWNNLFGVAAAAIFGGWSLITVSVKKNRNSHRVSLSLMIFTVAIITSVIFAPELGDAAKTGLFMISAIILMASVITALDTKEKVLRFLSIVLFFVTLTALYAFIQRMQGVEIDEEFVDTALNEGMPGRVYSTFANANNYAELLLLFLPFFVPVFVLSEKRIAKLLSLLGFAAVFTALLMTYSRSCWVGFAIAAVVFVALYDKRLLIPFAILAIAAIPFLPDTILNRILTIGSLEDSSNSYRIYIWESCVSMLRDFFVTGIGIGSSSFKNAYPAYASSVAITAPHSHMLYLELALETGIMGFLGFMGFIYSSVKKAFTSLTLEKSNFRTVIIAGVAALFGIAFVCCVEYIWFYPRVMFAFFVVPGILIASSRLGRDIGNA